MYVNRAPSVNINLIDSYCFLVNYKNLLHHQVFIYVAIFTVNIYLTSEWFFSRALSG